MGPLCLILNLKSFIKNDALSDSVAVFIRSQGLPYNNSDSVAIALNIGKDFYGDTLIDIHTFYGKPSWFKEYICFNQDKLTVFISSFDNNEDYLGLIDNTLAKKEEINKTQFISRNSIACFKRKLFEVFNGNVVTRLQVKDVFPDAKSNCVLYGQANHSSEWIIVFKEDSKFEAINTQGGGKCIIGKWYVKDNIIYLSYKMSFNLNDGNIEFGDDFRYDYFPEVYPDKLELINGVLYDRTDYSKWYSDEMAFLYEEIIPKDIYFVPLQITLSSD